MGVVVKEVFGDNGGDCGWCPCLRVRYEGAGRSAGKAADEGIKWLWQPAPPGCDTAAPRPVADGEGRFPTSGYLSHVFAGHLLSVICAGAKPGRWHRDCAMCFISQPCSDWQRLAP